MASLQTIRTVLGIIGNVLSFFLFLAPCPTFLKIVRWKSTRDFSGMPYIVTFLNCLLWVFYGLPVVHPNSMLVATTNSIGAALEISYILLFLFYSSKIERVKTLRFLVAVVCIFVVIAVLTMTLAHTIEMRTLVVGSIGVVIGTCMYASPLTIMKLVIQTKSVQYMPFLLSLAACLNGLCWTAYAALVNFDIFLTLPNGIGAVLGAAQLVLYAVFYDWGRTKKTIENLDEEQQSADAGDIKPAQQASHHPSNGGKSVNLIDSNVNGSSFYHGFGEHQHESVSRGDCAGTANCTVVNVTPVMEESLQTQAAA